MIDKPWGRRDIPCAFGDMHGRQVGEIWYDMPDGNDLPLLVKWLFTSDKLSVQVHPNDAQASARGLISGKEECWYIVDAAPGARLGIGTIEPLSAEELRAASLSGEIEGLMDWKAARAGDYFYLPAGTIHAIGAGITLVEIQQNADITYRLYDYQRLDNGKLRDLHLDDGVAVANAKPYADKRSGKAVGDTQLVNGPHFRMWLISSAAGLSTLPKNTPLWVAPAKGGLSVNGEYIGVGSCAYAGVRASMEIDEGSDLVIAAI